MTLASLLRGIIMGSDHFGIRQVCSREFKYIINLTPQAKFQNMIVTKNNVYASWKKKGQTDPDAAEKVRRYENRPAEELYDVIKDKYEWNNLASDPKYADVKSKLREKLYAWMAQQGDKGQATEMEAFEHQGSHVNKNKKQQPK